MDEKVAAKTVEEINSEIRGKLKMLCDSLNLYKGEAAKAAVTYISEIVEGVID